MGSEALPNDPLVQDRKSARLAKALEALERERSRRLEIEAKIKSQSTALEAEERRCRTLQEERDSLASDLQLCRRQASEVMSSHTAEVEELKESLRAISVCETESPASTKLFWRQRELLVRSLRRIASLEGDSSTLRDDVIRLNHIIYNLRQELQQQHQQAQQQQQQLQQEQVQQLQQLQQLHQLLQQQHTQQQQHQTQLRQHQQLLLQPTQCVPAQPGQEAEQQALGQISLQQLVEEIHSRDREITTLKESVVKGACGELQPKLGTEATDTVFTDVLAHSVVTEVPMDYHDGQAPAEFVAARNVAG